MTIQDETKTIEVDKATTIDENTFVIRKTRMIIMTIYKVKV